MNPCSVKEETRALKSSKKLGQDLITNQIRWLQRLGLSSPLSCLLDQRSCACNPGSGKASWRRWQDGELIEDQGDGAFRAMSGKKN